MLRVAAINHSIPQFIGMTDPQIFAFLVMPFLFGLTCSMVWFSGRKAEADKPADPPEPATTSNSYPCKPRKQQLAKRRTGSPQD
jgi:hypothetical protein